MSVRDIIRRLPFEQTSRPSEASNNGWLLEDAADRRRQQIQGTAGKDVLAAEIRVEDDDVRNSQYFVIQALFENVIEADLIEAVIGRFDFDHDSRNVRATFPRV